MNLTSALCPALPKPVHLARAANRLQQKLRPEHPKDLDFELFEECLPPGFFRADLEVRDRRHLNLTGHPFPYHVLVR